MEFGPVNMVNLCLNSEKQTFTFLDQWQSLISGLANFTLRNVQTSKPNSIFKLATPASNALDWRSSPGPLGTAITKRLKFYAKTSRASAPLHIAGKITFSSPEIGGSTLLQTLVK